ncbi:unnamed protein product, partial [Protopolystoma xenopodis]
LTRCLRCPAAYHPGQWCLPAGCQEVAPNWIVCPRHAKDTTTGLSIFWRNFPFPEVAAPCKKQYAVEDTIKTTIDSSNHPEADEFKLHTSGVSTMPATDTMAFDTTQLEIPCSSLSLSPVSPSRRAQVTKLAGLLSSSAGVYPPRLRAMLRPTNVSWCFICSKGGRIVCCESCPASFHEECLNVGKVVYVERKLKKIEISDVCLIPVPDKFICEDCTNGRMPRYGEIFWVRLPPPLNQQAAAIPSSGNPAQASDSLVEFSPNCLRPPDFASLVGGMPWWPAEVVAPTRLPFSESEDEENLENEAEAEADFGRIANRPRELAKRPEREKFGRQATDAGDKCVELAKASPNLRFSRARASLLSQMANKPGLLGFFPVRLFGLTCTSSQEPNTLLSENGVQKSKQKARSGRPQPCGRKSRQPKNVCTFNSENELGDEVGEGGGDSDEEKSTHHVWPVYLWTSRARVFPYEEGDDKRDDQHSSSSNNTSGDSDTGLGQQESDALNLFVGIEGDYLGNSVSMTLSVKLIDSWSRGIRRRILVELTFESLHLTLSFEVEVISS